MSVIVNPGDIITLVLNYTNASTPVAQNVLHYRIGLQAGNPGVVEFLTNFAGQALTGWGTAWAGAASSSVSLVSAKATSVFPLPRSTSVTATAVTPIAGSQSSDALPLQDSVTLLKKTAIGNRWGTGRLFYVGLAENGQANGLIGGATVTALATASAWLAAPLVTTGTGWTTTSNLVLLNGPEDNPVRITNVENVFLSDDVIKSMRRRRPGKGI